MTKVKLVLNGAMAKDSAAKLVPSRVRSIRFARRSHGLIFAVCISSLLVEIMLN